jgi:Zinc knuckle
MVRAGGAENADTELVAHVLATAPISYNPVTTLVHGRDLKEKDILKYTQYQYRVYWKRHFKDQGHQQRRHKMSTNVAYAVSDKDTTDPRTFNRNNNSNKPWKKFKGNCRKCGEQDHRADKCTKNTNSKETRCCFVCKQVGHISPNCPHKANSNNNSNNKL